MNEIQKMPEPENDAQAILQLILNENISQERLQFLIDIRKDMLARQAEISYRRSRAAMAVEMPIIDKKGRIAYPTRSGKMRSTQYELWEDVVEQITPVMSRHGFSIEFKAWTELPDAPAGKVKVLARLGHNDGHFEETWLTAPLDTSGEKNVIQQMKSTVSYLKRTTAGLLINFAARGEDDDAASAAPVAVDTGPLSDEQVKELEAKITAVKANRALFCQFWATSLKRPIAEVSDLPASSFEAAVEKLELFAKQQAKKRSGK